jgi:hypothetical protein
VLLSLQYPDTKFRGNIIFIENIDAASGFTIDMKEIMA